MKIKYLILTPKQIEAIKIETGELCFYLVYRPKDIVSKTGLVIAYKGWSVSGYIPCNAVCICQNNS